MQIHTIGQTPFQQRNSAKRDTTHLVGITINAHHPTDTKIEQSQLVTTVFARSRASLFEEGNDE